LDDKGRTVDPTLVLAADCPNRFRPQTLGAKVGILFDGVNEMQDFRASGQAVIVLHKSILNTKLRRSL
jgi:hypothetical protein